MTKELMALASRLAAIGSVVGLSAGCATEPTKATEVWKDPSYAAGPMKTVAIIGAKLNSGQRRMLEDGFVSALSDRGVRVVPSYKLFPNAFPSKDEARAALGQSGVDGILVVKLKGVKETVVHADPGFWEGYYTYSAGWGEPFYTTEPVATFETSLWDPSGPGKLVWSETTQTENPNFGKTFTASLTKEVVAKLDKAGLLPPRAVEPVSYAPEGTLGAF